MRTIEGVLYRKLNCFKIFDIAIKCALGLSIRAIAFCKSRIDKRTAYTILCSIVCSVFRYFHAGNVISTRIAVHSVCECRTIDRLIYNLELIEEIFVIATLHLRTKLKAKLLIIRRVSLGIVSYCHLNFILLIAR